MLLPSQLLHFALEETLISKNFGLKHPSKLFQTFKMEYQIPQPNFANIWQTLSTVWWHGQLFLFSIPGLASDTVQCIIYSRGHLVTTWPILSSLELTTLVLSGQARKSKHLNARLSSVILQATQPELWVFQYLFGSIFMKITTVAVAPEFIQKLRYLYSAFAVEY